MRGSVGSPEGLFDAAARMKLRRLSKRKLAKEVEDLLDEVYGLE